MSLEEQHDDDALFDEIAADMDSAAGFGPAESLDDEPETDAIEPEGGEAAADPEPDDDQESEESAELEGEGQDQTPSNDDLRAQLEALQTERDQWRHRYQSDEGRFRAAQQRLNELDRLKRQQEASPQNSDQQQAAIAKAGMEALQAGKFDEFKQDFPEMADAIDEHLQSYKQQILQQIKQDLAPLQTAHERQLELQQEAQRAEAARQLSERHPDWQDIETNPNFAHWLDQQPEGIRSLYGKPDANAAGRLLDLYKADTAPKAPQSPQNPGQTLTQKRQQRLERSQIPRTRTSAQSVDADDADAEFDAAAARVDREMSRRY